MLEYYRTNLKFKFLILSLLFFIILFSLDFFLSHFLYLKFPNQLEWDTSPWYNFLHKNYSIRFKKRDPDHDVMNQGVIIAGSSVALYSALPQDIEHELNQGRHQYKLEFYSHVAMSPMDLYYYLDDVIQKKPSTVLFLFNPADLQFDYIAEAKEGEGLTYTEEDRVNYYKQRHPVKIFYPWKFLKDNYKNLNRHDIVQLLTKHILYINKYRLFFKDPFEAYIERNYRSGRSYHNYTGMVPDNGIWRKGWTEAQFKINCEIKNGKFTESIFIPEDHTELYIYYQDRIWNRMYYAKSGWHKLNFKVPKEISNPQIKFEVNRTVSSQKIDPSLYGKEYFYGIRLSQNFCKQDIESDIAYIRKDSLDDKKLLEMSIQEYEEDYFARMYKDSDKRPELFRLLDLHKKKEILGRTKFQKWPEIYYLEKIAKKLKKENIRFILVNNPENPIELKKYVDTQWYKDLISHFEKLEKETSLVFYDLKDHIKDPRYFIDPHHLTYPGSQKMTPVYKKIILKNFP
ncbi:MAG: hypothetical protein H7A23_19240 [Leptospiraceae bacterium]|nr:hypothetical protein [Leptospiraceae bacterium]MCP5496690.1 hypothetical protein [Leptospiraceae bacterium]